MLNILIFIIFYFAIIFSVLGYGYLAINFAKNKYISNDLGYIGLVGILFLIIISYISHFFVSHNYIFNSLILIIGLLLFISQILKNKKFIEKKNIKILILVFIILFLGIMMYKTHDDFPYYHFPYTYYLTQSDIHIGVGNFGHGFRTSSSIFYLNSLFYLPLAKYYLFQLGAILIMGFSNLILLEKIFLEIRKKNINYLTYLSLLAFVFINVFFYRIQEHGTDKSAQILIFILFIELVYLKNLKVLADEVFSKIIIILTLIVSLKSFYILYSIFLIPLGMYFLNNKKINIKNYLFKNFSVYFFVVTIFLISMVSVLNSGCIVYPVSLTCFDSLSWSIPILEVNHMNNWYEQWSKAGAGPNFRVENPEIYIQKFNWVNHWFEYYFFNKVSDFLLGIFFVVLVFIIVFSSKNKKKLNKNNFYFDYYVILLILFIEWFYNHPALRYGGYSIIALMIFYPLSYSLQIFINHQKKIKKITILILGVTAFIFASRNIDRLFDERVVYNYKPEINIFYKVDKNHFRIEREFKKLINDYNNCLKISNECDKKNMKVNMFLNKYIYLNQKK